jgi:hypothetical protein
MAVTTATPRITKPNPSGRNAIRDERDTIVLSSSKGENQDVVGIAGLGP